MLIDEGLQKLRTEMVQMAQAAEKIVQTAIGTIWNRDATVVSTVREMDKGIDAAEMRIDEICMGLFLKEPYAHDLRYVVSCIKSIKDLERLGDEAKTVAKWSLKLTEPPPAQMRELADRSTEAVKMAVQSLIEEKAQLAEKIMELEFQVDELEDAIIARTTSVAEAFIAKALERIGDLATNIAENVVFAQEAADIRHGKFQ